MLRAAASAKASCTSLCNQTASTAKRFECSLGHTWSSFWSCAASKASPAVDGCTGASCDVDAPRSFTAPALGTCSTLPKSLPAAACIEAQRRSLIACRLLSYGCKLCQLLNAKLPNLCNVGMLADQQVSRNLLAVCRTWSRCLLRLLQDGSLLHA